MGGFLVGVRIVNLVLLSILATDTVRQTRTWSDIKDKGHKAKRKVLEVKWRLQHKNFRVRPREED